MPGTKEILRDWEIMAYLHEKEMLADIDKIIQDNSTGFEFHHVFGDFEEKDGKICFRILSLSGGEESRLLPVDGMDKASVEELARETSAEDGKSLHFGIVSQDKGETWRLLISYGENPDRLYDKAREEFVRHAGIDTIEKLESLFGKQLAL